MLIQHCFPKKNPACSYREEIGPTITISLWTWGLDISFLERQKLLITLSQEERQRANKYVYETDKNRFIVARGRTREILAELTKSLPSEIEFIYGANGKPTLPSPSPLFFNLSRSQNLACLAVCTELELGVDIEQVRPIQRHSVETFFSPAEQKALSTLCDDRWLKAFYRCWTSKEAFVKAIGEGLLHPLDSFDVSVDANKPAQLLRLAGDIEAEINWSILEFTPQPGFFGALSIAAKRENISLQVTRI